MNFLKQIFTWWHRQTTGTFIYTLFTGNNIESSKIPPEWHSWIHFLRTNKPSVQTKKFSWQIQHEENLTGTKKAYKPDGSLINDLKKDMKKYESWKP